MSRYELLLTVHILAAIAWLGSALCVQLLGIRASRARDTARQQQLGAEAQWLATRLFIPSSLIVLIFGILLVLDGPWAFDQTWVLLGLAGYAVSFLLGILYFRPESARIRRAGEAQAYDELARRVARIERVSQGELVILFLVVVDMVAKPGL